MLLLLFVSATSLAVANPISRDAILKQYCLQCHNSD